MGNALLKFQLKKHVTSVVITPLAWLRCISLPGMCPTIWYKWVPLHIITDTYIYIHILCIYVHLLNASLQKLASWTANMMNPQDGTSIPFPAMVTSNKIKAAAALSIWKIWHNIPTWNCSAGLGWFREHVHILLAISSPRCQFFSHRHTHDSQHLISSQGSLMFLAPPWRVWF